MRNVEKFDAAQLALVVIVAATVFTPYFLWELGVVEVNRAILLYLIVLSVILYHLLEHQLVVERAVAHPDQEAVTQAQEAEAEQDQEQYRARAKRAEQSREAEE